MFLRLVVVSGEGDLERNVLLESSSGRLRRSPADHEEDESRCRSLALLLDDPWWQALQVEFMAEDMEGLRGLEGQEGISERRRPK